MYSIFIPLFQRYLKKHIQNKGTKKSSSNPSRGRFSEIKRWFIEGAEFTRGWYASPIGWINSHGIGEFYVAIRSGLIEQETAHFYAGCGIVEDSDPENEWLETELKFKPMVDAVRLATHAQNTSTTSKHYAKDPIL